MAKLLKKAVLVAAFVLQLVTAVPDSTDTDLGIITPEAATTLEIFSFEKWVKERLFLELLVFKPSVSNYSVSKPTDVNPGINAVNALVKRDEVTCDHLKKYGYTPAYVPDAVRCIDYLASLGGYPCRVLDISTSYCVQGNARFRDVAATAGRILDAYCSPDDTVQGVDFALQNSWIAVHVSSPSTSSPLHSKIPDGRG
ncbi:hypothetical protein QBC35DRAFT_456911 [Podospora australis]|uniref:Uncharacterized protein n=1 Tax=Podospora australis TaxID=1536484 RepID=A0AAN7AEF0_9PEZI|nr:hypothetical protein QBC35DRAFT_456911 [Podospora australis]